MISVDETLGHIFDLVGSPSVETVPLRHAAGRVLLKPATATRSQPPFAASIMDGYAIPDSAARPGDTYQVIGEAAAGHQFAGTIRARQSIRIFTGAPVPDGAERIIIQEDVDRTGDTIRLRADLDPEIYIREAGRDFKAGDTVAPPLRLSPAHVALLAAMNIPRVTVARRPSVALIATGDELVMPGESPEPDQIIASNTFGIAAILEQEGAAARILPIARDNREALTAAFDLARGADLIVTIGGASVGDHDLVGRVASDQGMERAFYKIAMRPGKPLMAGRMGDAPLVGLPGNPVSSMVCTHIFLRPMIRAMLGLGTEPLSSRTAPLNHPVEANGPRQHYMRGCLENDRITLSDRQDSALLSVLAEANVLVVRPPNDGEKGTGEVVEFIEY